MEEVAPVRRPDVIVVGGGIIGCAVAYHLACEGAQVAVIERHRAGGQASGAAAGMLAPFSEAHDAGPFLALGRQSLALMPALAARLREETGIDVEHVPSGLLRVALDEEEADDLARRLAWQREAGVAVERLDGPAARALEPGLPETVRAALYYPEEHHVFSPHLVRALALAAAARGAAFLEGTEATGLLAEGCRVRGVSLCGEGAGVVPGGERLEGGHVVLATGAWTAVWGPRLGVDLPVYPVRGQIIALEQAPLPVRRIVFSARGYAVPKVRGTVVIGATEDRAGFDNRVTAAGLATLAGLAPQLVPALERAYFHHAWAGLRPWSATGLPLIGPVPGWEGITVAAGHYRNGILLSAVTGRAVAALLSGRAGAAEAAATLAPFAPAPYDAGRGDARAHGA